MVAVATTTAYGYDALYVVGANVVPVPEVYRQPETEERLETDDEHMYHW